VKCQMSKFKFQIKLKCQIPPNPPLLKGGEGDYRLILSFFIDLTFACLPVGRDFDI